MKYTFLLVLTVLFHQLRSQPYKPLLEEENEWHVTYCFGGCLTDKYFTDGDTLVNNLQYKILDGYHFISRTFLLREELQNKKVYLAKVEPGHSDEYLLYDFSLEEGDSIQMLNPVSPFPDEGGYFILDSIRQRPLADGNLYRHFYFSPAASNSVSNWNPEWIEGAGSLSLINSPGGNPDINGVGRLSCMFKGGELFFHDPEIEPVCNSIMRSVDEAPGYELKYYQDKIRKKLVLVSSVKLNFIKIYDTGGMEIYAGKMNSIGNNWEADISKFTSGIYFVSVIDEFNKKKFIKIILQ